MSLDAALAPVTEVIEGRLGTSCSGPRAGHIMEAVREGMARAGVADPMGYARLLEHDVVVRADLAESLRVCETYFLRERGQLEMLRDQVLPTLAARSARKGSLRLWSAGCSSGEEAYSLAIALELAGLPGRARILATDRSAEALAAAERGGVRNVVAAEPGWFGSGALLHGGAGAREARGR
jgi:chemotaxis methyl-accepting protein methylase